MIERSDQLTVISDFTFKSIRENLNLSNVPVEIIYNRCNLPDDEAVFQKPSFITTDTPFIFSIGTITQKTFLR